MYGWFIIKHGGFRLFHHVSPTNPFVSWSWSSDQKRWRTSRKGPQNGSHVRPGSIGHSTSKKWNLVQGPKKRTSCLESSSDYLDVVPLECGNWGKIWWVLNMESQILLQKWQGKTRSWLLRGHVIPGTATRPQCCRSEGFCWQKVTTKTATESWGTSGLG